MSEARAVDPYADHERMENHWWWRPGWKVGTRFYAWHITLDGQDDLHRLMDDYAEALGSFPYLDPVPRRWRHITLQGLGHVEDVTDGQRDAAVEAVRARLHKLEPIHSTFGRASVFKEAIALPPSNPEEFAHLRNEIRGGIADAWGDAPERASGFRAHTSDAYSNAHGDGRAIRQMIDGRMFRRADASFQSISLIRMHRDHRMYQWETLLDIAIGG